MRMKEEDHIGRVKRQAGKTAYFATPPGIKVWDFLRSHGWVITIGKPRA